MVKAEKIVVLSILFLVVGLFGWSLGAETETTEGQAGGDDGQAATAQEPQAGVETFARRPPAVDVEVADAEDAAPEAAAPAAPLLDVASVEPAALVEPEPVQALAVRMRPGWDIVSTEGLETTVDPDTLVFRPTEGQTWEEIADAVYGDASKAIALRRGNEGMAVPGEVVLVPASVGSLEELGERLAVVRQGESLWGVSRRTLGKGSRWREIYEANRGVIADPDYVAPGTELAIPSR